MFEGLNKIIEIFHRKGLFEYTLFIFGLLLTYLSSLYSYLLFHSIAELFSIIISGGIFLIGWNSRKYVQNSFFLVLGLSFIFVGILDLIHTLAYSGMGVFIGFTSNLPTQLWISARYLQAFSFLFAIFVINKKLNSYYLMVIFIIIDSLLLVLIFGGIFPICYIEGLGLTAFKIVSEYIIDVILLICLGLLLRNRQGFNKKVLMFLLAFLISTIFSELFFTFYISVFGIFNSLGHIFKIVAFFFMYKAIIEMGLENPLQLMFKKLSESEENYRNLIENSLEGVWVIDKEAKTTLINPAMAEMIGYSVEDMIGRSLFEFMSEDQRQLANNYFKRRMDGIKEDHDFTFTHRSGRKVFTWLRTSPLYDDHGNFKSAIAFITDITERKLAQEKIADIAKFPSENPDPILRVSKKYVLFANKEAQRIFDVGEGSRIPQTLKQSVKTCFERNENTEVELTVDNLTFSIFIVPIKGAGYVNIYGKNITARKKAQRELEHFVSTVSHELRTPISILIMSLDYLDNHKDKISQETYDKLQKGIKKNIYLLRELVENILILSRIDEKKVDLEWEKYNPYDVFIEILDLMGQIAQEKNISIELSIHKSIILYGDKKKIDQIYRIFIDNAIKYSKFGSKIEIKAIDNYLGDFNKDKQIGVLLQFEDKGIGISEKDKQHIFERFFRSEQVSDIPGTGLGLSIAKELINLHLGSVYVESAYGKGSTFSVFFPRIERKIN
jgi:PAS domain S-box-containing protein